MKKKGISFPSPLTIITMMIVTILIYAFLSGITTQFYASALFLFYSLVGRMWVAVVMLGVFQVLIMIPFRVVNLKLSSNINEFKEKTESLKSEEDQVFYVREHMRKGDRTILYYTVDFIAQVVSYVSIGRLFLTDFYSIRLNPELLYSFIPYPEYPIEGTFFKLPYPIYTHTTDLGMKWVFIVWAILIITQLIIHIARYLKHQNQKAIKDLASQSRRLVDLAKYINRNVVILMILAWILLRNFPVGWEIHIFSGDISIPNRRFNTITAIVTAGTVMWFGANKIKRKTELAVNQHVDQNIILQTQKDMFKETVRSAVLLGLGAFFITNHIPSAFELSIFTFELIALLSPFTLDKIILNSNTLNIQQLTPSYGNKNTKKENDTKNHSNPPQ